MPTPVESIDAATLDDTANGQGSAGNVNDLFPSLTTQQYNYLQLLAAGIRALTPPPAE